MLKKEINTKELMNKYEKLYFADSDIKSVNNHPDIYSTKRKQELFENYKTAKKDFEAAAEKLTDAIIAAEGRSRERTITAFDICSILQKYTRKLDITKKAMEGTKITVNINAQSFPKAYKYTPMSTKFKAEFRGGSWRITDIYRDECGEVRVNSQLSEEAKNAAFEKFMQGLTNLY